MQPARSADRGAISCPSGVTVFLEGSSRPGASLLVYFAGSPVGGGSAGSNGNYRIPLRVKERPGVYPVEVRLRDSRALVDRFECYVDVALEIPPTATPEIVVTAAPTQAVPTPTVQTTPATPSSGPAQPSATSTTPTTTTPTARVSPTPTVRPTNEIADGVVQIIEVAYGDPDFPEEEYVQIVNGGSTNLDITGWKLINATRSDQPTYVFPRYEFPAGNVLVVWSSEGTNNLSIGDFYWGLSQSVWRVGDIAELRDPSNRLIDTFTVSD